MTTFFYFSLLSIIYVCGQNQAPVADTDTWGFSQEWSEMGYIPVYNNERALFYWAWDAEFRFSESTETPLILWLSGPDGYGVSSIRDMFFANGPYKILEFPGPYGTDTLKMTLNPFKWNSLANMVWVDQPAGSGYSYSNTSDPVATFEDAAEDLCEFLTQFFEKYEKYEAGEFYIGGDGDAATILLALSEKLLDAESTCPDVRYIGMILNGPVIDIRYHWTGAVKTATEYGVFSPEVLEIMEEQLTLCLDHYLSCSSISPKAGGNQVSPEWSGCMFNFLSCKLQLLAPSELKASGVVFDEFNIMNSDCKLDENLYTNSKCNQDFLTGLDRWLQEDEVLTAYGVPQFTTGFDMYNTTVAHDFLASGARHTSYVSCLEKALAAGIRVLIWTGEYDFYGSPFGLQLLLRDTQGYQDILDSELQSWTSTLQEEVFFQQKEELVYATVAHSGHHLSFDFPRATQGFFVEWLYGMNGLSKATTLIPNAPNFAVETASSSSSVNQTNTLIYGAIIGVLGTVLLGLILWFVKTKLLNRAIAQTQYEKSYCTTGEPKPVDDIENININLR